MDGIVGTVAFGNMYGTEHFAHKEHFHHVIDEAMVVRSSFSAEDYFPNTLGRLVDRLTGVASLREMVFKEFDAFFEMMLGQAKPDNAGCVGLIDVLIRLMKERQQGSFTVSRDVVKGLLTNTFIGAVDTGAVTIIWAMAELVRNPHVLNKVQNEILVNAWAIGRDPTNWENPEEFIPERFKGEEDVNFNRAQFEFLPFGAGRRMCPGIDMGLATTEFTLANLLYCFDWELPEGLRSEDMSMEEAGGLTIHKKTRLLLVPTRYKCGSAS
ncbi:unnamed protein product [Triticum turgidum subsp. durum]|uniref:4-hydroxyphenylacetaldehyde oxime monooxygenase n=1 Tax=Triticum turgidum subsp. durum TaxID=4567 RepID=A0A9R0W5M2_TRITD|nr:unnamed protein product [Triticum turgidum subsp. durum]